ncbi:zinc finger, CCHC-type containing protein, partial [Tanacetum coccineum]
GLKGKESEEARIAKEVEANHKRIKKDLEKQQVLRRKLASKEKSEEARIAKEVEANQKRIKKDLEKQHVLRQKEQKNLLFVYEKEMKFNPCRTTITYCAEIAHNVSTNKRKEILECVAQFDIVVTNKLATLHSQEDENLPDVWSVASVKAKPYGFSRMQPTRITEPNHHVIMSLCRTRRGAGGCIDSKGFLEFFDCPGSRQGVEDLKRMMEGTEFDIEKFDANNDFGLWHVKMKALPEQQGLATGVFTCSHSYHQGDKCSGDLKKKLETLYMTKSLANRLYLKKKLYTFNMHPGKSQSEYIDEFHKLVGDLAAIDTAISDEDQAFLLLTSLPSSYDNFVETLLYGRDTLKLEDVLTTLNSKELQNMTEAKGDGGEGLYVRGRSGQNRYGVGYNHKKSQGFVKNDQVSVMKLMEYDGGNILLGDGRECRIQGIGKVQVQMRDGSSFVLDNIKYVPELRRNLISLGTLKKEGFTVKMQSDKIKEETLKGRKQLGEYQIGWKIKTGNILDFCNQRSTQQCTKSGIAKHLGVAGLQQQNGLVEETNVTLLAKVVLYRNMCFNESGEYKKTFIGSGVGTGSVQVLQRVEFEVEPQEDHRFEVEPHGNVDHVVEDSNEAVFAVAAVGRIYAHESLTFNNTVACEAISKWKAGLKDDMDARLDVYVLSNGCRKCSDDNDAEIWVTKGLLVKAKGNILGLKIIRDQSGNTLRVSQSRVYNGKSVQTLLEGHSILSLEVSLSGDCDVEKNDVGMLDKFDRGLQTDVHVFEDFDYTIGRSITVMAAYMTLTEAAKEVIRLKGLALESGFKLKIVAGIAIGALSKAIPGLRFQHRLKLLHIKDF